MSYTFAIVGCGRIAQRHAAHIASQGGRLIAVCDLISGKAASFASEYNCKPYASIEEMLQNEKPDVVTICTPNGLHASHSIQSLASGAHVLCEKPMCLSVSDSSKMIDEAAKNGKRLFVVKQNRYNPPVVAVKKLLNDGKLGKIISFQLNCFWNRPASYYNDQWRGTLELDGGTLFTQFSHFVDLLYWFLGDMRSVKGIRNNYLHKKIIAFEDTGAAILEMEQGAIGTFQYTVNSYGGNMEGSITLFGEKGTVKIGGQYLNELDFFSVEGETRPVIGSSNPANHYGLYQGSMSNHDKVYENLIKTLDNPSHEFVEAKEAMKTVDIIEKIYQASILIDAHQ